MLHLKDIIMLIITFLLPLLLGTMMALHSPLLDTMQTGQDMDMMRGAEVMTGLLMNS